MRSIEFGKRSAEPQGQGQEPAGGSSAAGRLMRALQKQPAAAGPWGLQPAMLSFGMGANFELDSMQASLHTRLKFQDWFTLKARFHL